MMATIMMKRMMLMAMTIALLIFPQRTVAFVDNNVLIIPRPCYQGVGSMPVRMRQDTSHPRSVSRLLESRQQQEEALQSTNNSINDFPIKEVANRAEASAVMAFWNYSLPLDEFLTDNPDFGPAEALKLLTPFHNDQGQKQVLSGGEFVHFVATDPVTGLLAATVDVHRKEETDDGGVTVELKNLRVKDQYRRRGIARDLVEAVKNHAIQQCRQLRATKATVYLHVELNNDAATPLYVSQGFEFDEREECKMAWTSTCS